MVLLPLQIVFVPLSVRLGVVKKETPYVAVFVQPFAFEPTTVYVVAAVGVTAILVVVAPPGDQTYPVAPEAVSVVLVPLQTVLVPVTETVGLDKTVTVTKAGKLVHPTPSVTIHVYVVVTVGEAVVVFVSTEVFVLGVPNPVVSVQA